MGVQGPPVEVSISVTEFSFQVWINKYYSYIIYPMFGGEWWSEEFWQKKYRHEASQHLEMRDQSIGYAGRIDELVDKTVKLIDEKKLKELFSVMGT